MKKTLIALLALTGVAAAELDPTPLTLTFTKDITATSSLPDDFDVDSISLTGDATTCLDQGTYKSDYLRPNTNVDLNNTSWTLTFTLGNDSGSDYLIDNITIDAFSFTGGGATQNNNRNFLFTVTAGETTVATRENLYIKGNDHNGSKGSFGSLTLDLDNSVTIAANDSLTFAITVNQGGQVTEANGGGQGRGSFVGIETVRFNAVPEPATATLSLLALAGLAARRRRK